MEGFGGLSHVNMYLYNVVEDDVWHTTPDTLDLKYRENFKMSFMTFKWLVLELTPFLEPIMDYVVRAFILVLKQVKLILFLLATSMSPKLMNDLYKCGTFTICKYTTIFVGFLVLGIENYLVHTFIHQLLRCCMIL